MSDFTVIDDFFREAGLNRLMLARAAYERGLQIRTDGSTEFGGPDGEPGRAIEANPQLGQTVEDEAMRLMSREERSALINSHHERALYEQTTCSHWTWRSEMSEAGEREICTRCGLTLTPPAPAQPCQHRFVHVRHTLEPGERISTSTPPPRVYCRDCGEEVTGLRVTT